MQERGNMKLQGTISTYFSGRGYGFISENRQVGTVRYFFHRTNLPGIEPTVGTEVQFDFVQTSKGMAAVNIEVASRPAHQDGSAA
jgi:cold shock CspA family protein